ncbi:MAG: MFS transporter [Candidatus Marinimicrobia bacterium]|jgi:MFS family permease|nr:MFS transporter [Candidatus Neomarinimicrobiota bacterium]
MIEIFKKYDKRLWILMSGMAISAMGFGAIVPFLSIYFHSTKGISMSAVGTFFLVASVARAFSQTIGGELSDHIGRKKILLWSQFSRAVIMVSTGYAVFLDMNYWAIAGIIFLNYLLASSFFPVTSAMIVDLLPEEDRAEGFAIMRTAINFGWGMGPAIGGFLSVFGFEYLFYFTALSSLVSGLLILFNIEETNVFIKKSNKKLSYLFTNIKFSKYLIIFLISTIFLYLTWGQFVSTLSVFMNDNIKLTHKNIGYIYTYNGLLVILFQIYISRKVKKYNMFLIIIIGSLFFFLGYSLLGFAESFLGIMIFVTIFTFGEMLAGPTGNTIISNMSPKGQYGRYQGLYGLFTTTGWSLGPFIGGICIDLIPNVKILWLFLSSFSLIASIGFYLLYRSRIEVENAKP